jgi:hypothetical protein
MSRVEIVSLDMNHAEIASYLREADLNEIAAYGFWESAEECVEYSISMTDVGWAGVCDEGIVAIGGAVCIGGRAGVAWLLSSVLADRYPVSFGKYTRALFESLKREYDALVNFTDAGYSKALRWLEWLGFAVEPPAPLRMEGKEFCLVHWAKSQGASSLHPL